ncbi:MAG: hypothetical protein C0599_08745 [Salinivirgaceae bacterium]|nr:MAG: hypothetical protein C0599_08745 [Salinivirgaceae bacterium]
MKKNLILIAAFLLISSFSFGQLFSTGQTLKPKKWSVGVEPSVLVNGDAEFMLFGHAGYGLKKGIDLGLKVGFLGDYDEYIGGDVEFAIGRYFSVMGGAHHFGNFGLDANILGTYPIKSDVRISSGFDVDIVFIDRADNPNTTEDESGMDTEFIGWVPISLEIGLKKNLAFIFETMINVTDAGYHFIGGGVNIYI